VQVVPERGEEQPLDAPLQLVFDQPMDQESVEAAFTIEPAIAGEFEWPSDRTMRFKPLREGFKRATKYTVTVEDDARSAEDLPLDVPVEFRFATVGYLEIAAVQPANGTAEVATDVVVTLLFNRPVVPLSAVGADPVGADRDLPPQPLTFVPTVRGQGEWLNTSIYRFIPDEGFAPATAYKARVAAGLVDVTGGVLADAFIWEFTTIMPAVVATYPDANTQFVSPEPIIHVAFNQPMDHASAEAAFQLGDPATGGVIGGSFEWHDGGLVLPRRDVYEPYRWSWGAGQGPERVGVETMSFTPERPLDFNATYRAQVAAGAKGAAGMGAAGTPEDVSWFFSTIEYPRVVKTDPIDGEQRADPRGGLRFEFSSPMDPESLDGRFTIAPPVSATDVYTYWWDSDTQLEISFPVEPNTD